MRPFASVAGMGPARRIVLRFFFFSCSWITAASMRASVSAMCLMCRCMQALRQVSQSAPQAMHLSGLG